MYMVMFGTVACTAVLAFLVPSTGMLLLVAAGASFLILWLYAALGMLVLPFQESTACGLMCMFVPFYALYYLITRWDAMRGPFLSGLAAYGIVVVAAIGLPAVNAARMAAQRAVARDELARGAPGGRRTTNPTTMPQRELPPFPPPGGPRLGLASGRRSRGRRARTDVSGAGRPAAGAPVPDP